MQFFAVKAASAGGGGGGGGGTEDGGGGPISPSLQRISPTPVLPPAAAMALPRGVPPLILGDVGSSRDSSRDSPKQHLSPAAPPAPAARRRAATAAAAAAGGSPAAAVSPSSGVVSRKLRLNKPTSPAAAAAATAAAAAVVQAPLPRVASLVGQHHQVTSRHGGPLRMDRSRWGGAG